MSSINWFARKGYDFAKDVTPIDPWPSDITTTTKQEIQMPENDFSYMQVKVAAMLLNQAWPLMQGAKATTDPDYRAGVVLVTTAKSLIGG